VIVEDSRREAAPSAIALLAASLRPEQWTKNLLLFAGLIFGGRLLDPAAVGAALAAFVIFCALSGAMYIVNDVRDREADRRHPLKQTRPLASGALGVGTALGAATVIAAGAIAWAASISAPFALVALAYAALLFLYSTVLKHIVIIDVLAIAGGFVLRAIAGAVVVNVPTGMWLLTCTTLLALFLALSKRRHELVLLGDQAGHHRRSLDEYSPYLLDQMIAVVTASTVIAYAVFATSGETAERLGTGYLGVTIPFVLYGIFRYLYLVHQKHGGGSPAALLATDPPLLACVALWAATIVLLMYTPLGR
jgi:4-hydroxybenzoate polyprenyltransferase